MSAYSFSIHAEESKQTTVLGEITVTGEKFERSQSSTGSSTTVVTGDQFKREANLLSATQLLKRDVNILDTGLGNDLPTVRGVDGSGPAVGAVAFFAVALASLPTAVVFSFVAFALLPKAEEFLPSAAEFLPY